MSRRRLVPLLLWLVLTTVAASAPASSPGLRRAASGSEISAVANSSEATRRPDLGIFEDVQYMAGRTLIRRLNAYRGLGIRYMRFQLEWSDVQPRAAGGHDWRSDDAVVRGLLARGIQPLVLVDGAPTWARPAGCRQSPSCAPADPRQFAHFAAAAVAHYKAMGVHYWEIWNEPNSSVFWRPHPDVAAYTALLRDSYGAMKAVDPGAVVLTGGTAPAIDTNDRRGNPIWISPTQFLSGVYADGGGGFFDGVSVHPYDFPKLPGARNPGSAWYQMYGTSISIRGLMVSHGDGAKLVWGTEFGAPTGPAGHGDVSPAVQAETVTRGYALWRSYPWTGPLIWFLYQDTGTDRSSPDEQFGLRRFDGALKPAYFAFRSAIDEQP